MRTQTQPMSGFLHLALPSGAAGRPSELSELDRILIRTLQVDGRRSFAAMARDLDLPEKTIRRRVHELLESCIIQIATVADPAVLGYTVAALIGLNVDGQRRIRPLVESLAQLPAVDYAAITTGRFDALVEVLCRDMTELRTVVDETLVGAPGVRSAEVFPYLRLHYQEPGWEVAQQKQDGGLGPAHTPLDDTDHRIIAELSADGRRPFALVGGTLGVSESQIRKRVTRMLAERTIRITAIVNPCNLGFERQLWIGIRCQPGHSITAVADTLARIPSITYVVVCAGRFDLFVEAVCHDTAAVMRLIDTEVRTLTGVRSTELLFCLDLFYRAVRPAEPAMGG